MTTEDVAMVAEGMGIDRREITEDVLSRVRQAIKWGGLAWEEVLQDVLSEAVKPPRKMKGRQR